MPARSCFCRPGCGRWRCRRPGAEPGAAGKACLIDGVWPLLADNAKVGCFLRQPATAGVRQLSVAREGEWESACRGGSRGRYSFGDAIDATMALFGSSAGPVAPGSFPANAFGLYDMHGNVREWTADLWHESYDSTPLDGSPATEGHGSMRVVRGGGWSDGAPMLRSAARMRATQSARTNVIGFRVVRVLG